MKVLMQTFKQFYIPPLCKLYYDRIALEKIVFNVPLFVRIADPDSWLVKNSYQKYQSISKNTIEYYLQCVNAYLAIEHDGSVFEGKNVLTLNDSIPYIEWQSNQILHASTDLLGKYAFFIDLSDFEGEEEILDTIIYGFGTSFDQDIQLVLIGSAEKVGQLHATNFLNIDPDKTAHLSFAERFKFRNKNGLTLFNFGSRPYFLVSPKGKLITFFTKQDQQVLMDEVKKYIQLDQ